jgi:hypothetical protein
MMTNNAWRVCCRHFNITHLVHVNKVAVLQICVAPHGVIRGIRGAEFQDAMMSARAK